MPHDLDLTRENTHFFVCFSQGSGKERRICLVGLNMVYRQRAPRVRVTTLSTLPPGKLGSELVYGVASPRHLHPPHFTRMRPQLPSDLEQHPGRVIHVAKWDEDSCVGFCRVRGDTILVHGAGEGIPDLGERRARKRGRE